MRSVVLHIDSPDGSQQAALADELTIGRTDASQLVLSDSGLSRRNSTFFRDGDEVLVVDDDSTNGTFVNGERLGDTPRLLRDGDQVRMGNSTTIRVEFDASGRSAQPSENVQPHVPSAEPVVQTALPVAAPAAKADHTLKWLAAGAVGFTVLIVLIAGVALFLSSRNSTAQNTANGARPTPRINTQGRIPMRVVDPLGDENEDDLDDLIASWEVPEKEIDASTVADVKVGAGDTDESDLNVPASLLQDRQKKALEPRNAETGIRPAGLNVPKELFGDGVIKQKAKLREMKADGYQQPLDFADLAEKRIKKDLIEMPMAAESYYLDVGGSASDGPFQSFAFPNVHADIPAGSEKYNYLAQLAANFSGQHYDLNNPADRKQMRVRMLRMFNSRAKPILLEVAQAYFQKFGRPLRVTSLTRSMDYQIGLNSSNVNSFKVRDANALPPHTSGCAFDLARKHMTAEEQNFLMQKLASMEDSNRLDALIEYGENACFHIFIYFDGKPPKM